LLLGIPILLTIPALLVWRPIVARIGPRRAWIAASFCFIPGFTVILLADSFSVGLIGTLLAVPGLGPGSMIMPFPLLSEVIDDDAARHGYRREGVFFGINGGATKLAFSAQGLLFATVLSLSGYVAGSDIQATSAAWGVRFLIGVTPIIASLLIVLLYVEISVGNEQLTIDRGLGGLRRILRGFLSCFLIRENPPHPPNPRSI
jgi:GPH family glycoside/pentoside/hexuronide:cation symporter